jgi:hypothetical protein
MRKCQSCQRPDPTAMYRQMPASNLKVLCAACFVDTRTSSTRAVTFKAREVEDRYTLLARKHGLA